MLIIVHATYARTLHKTQAALSRIQMATPDLLSVLSCFSSFSGPAWAGELWIQENLVPKGRIYSGGASPFFAKFSSPPPPPPAPSSSLISPHAPVAEKCIPLSN